ncbi:deoxyribonuclease gamma [Lissotriton helveticus]
MHMSSCRYIWRPQKICSGFPFRMRISCPSLTSGERMVLSYQFSPCGSERGEGKSIVSFCLLRDSVCIYSTALRSINSVFLQLSRAAILLLLAASRLVSTTFKMFYSAFLLFYFFNNILALKICSFNVRSFGEAKIAKPEVLDVIVKVISRCDVMLIMEIKDIDNKVLPFLMERLNSQPEKRGEKNMYQYVISQRLGRKTYKEQYAFIYKCQMVTVKAVYQYPDDKIDDVDAFSREPFVVWFEAPNTDAKEFVIIPQHTTPEAAVREIDELYDVYMDVKQNWTSPNFIFMGDFNAGCEYVRRKHWKYIRLRENPEFVWLIGDKNDTTVKDSTNCAYDRIVIHGESLLSAIVPNSAAVFNFREAFGLSEEQALAVSDHFSVEMELKANTSILDGIKTQAPKKNKKSKKRRTAS